MQSHSGTTKGVIVWVVGLYWRLYTQTSSPNGQEEAAGLIFVDERAWD